MATHILKLYDRSRVTTDWTCPRKRYWNYEYEGKGLVPLTTSLELFMGTTIHDGLAAIAGGLDINTVATTAFQQMYNELIQASKDDPEQATAIEFAKEQSTLVEGLLRGFYRQVWPKLMEEYPTIKLIEGDLLYTHDGLGFMSKPDLVLANAQGENMYIEYKSTSSKKEGWVNSWNTAVQLHSTIRAIESQLKEKVTGVIVQGLYKGYDSGYGQNSPMCYGYRKNGNPPFSTTETLYSYKAGYKRFPTWEMDGGVAGWVAGMPSSILADQFPQTPPIFVKDDMINAFFAQRNVREREIDMAMELLKMNDLEAGEHILNTSFPQRFDQCQPGWGKPCGFRKLCFGQADEPLSQGFEYRVPHHVWEQEEWNVKS